MALSSATQDVLWLRMLLEELGFKQHEPSIIFQDNKSTIDIATNNKVNSRTKHIDVRHHFIKDNIQTKHIRLVKQPTGKMIADLFTKNLPYPLFAQHRQALGLTRHSS